MDNFKVDFFDRSEFETTSYLVKKKELVHV
jgi:hypothetical protein